MNHGIISTYTYDLRVDSMSAKDQTRAKINQTIIELVQGDITKEQVDAIVNAANSSLLGGGGVDGAIHRAAGSELLKETRTLNGCKTGDAKITKGYRLPAKYVIHAVGPIYQRNSTQVADLLASAYRRSLEVALENGLTSISFPAISTGVYSYPLDEASSIALNTICKFAQKHEGITNIRFVLFTDDAYAQFKLTLAQIVANNTDIDFV